MSINTACQLVKNSCNKAGSRLVVVQLFKVCEAFSTSLF